jgi:hypothetical protein
MNTQKTRYLRELFDRAAKALNGDVDLTHEYKNELIEDLQEAADDMYEEMIACEGQCNIRRV